MTPIDAVLDHAPVTDDRQGRSDKMLYTILVADDQRDVLDALRLLFRAHELAVVSASSPAEALAAVKACRVHAALVDLNYDKGQTTGEQGLALVTALRKFDPSLPVIAMTAWSSIELALQAMQHGARDFVEKPWDEGRLVATVRAQAELGCALRRVAELESEVHRLRTAGSSNGSAASFAEMRLLEVEGALVKQAMERFKGNISRAARSLGLSRSALYRRLDRHHLGPSS
jgi:DNA-binding NtrC family response regulator